MYMHKKKLIGGFTLIEIMVVVSIIGILSSIILFSISGARQSARDKQRVSDLSNIRFGIELYKETYGDYPVYASGVEIGAGNSIDIELSTFVSNLRGDPLRSGSGEYGYWYFSDFDCNGVPRHVVVAKKMESVKNGNYNKVCGGSALAPSGLLDKLIPKAHAGGYGQGAYYSEASYYSEATYYNQGSYYSEGAYTPGGGLYSQGSYYAQGSYTSWLHNTSDLGGSYIVIIK